MDMIDDVMMADFITIGSRTNEPFSDETKATIEAIINEKVPAYGFKWSQMKTYRHSDCEYPDSEWSYWKK